MPIAPVAHYEEWSVDVTDPQAVEVAAPALDDHHNGEDEDRGATPAPFGAIAALPGRLASSASGVSFVYEALEAVAQAFALDDVAVVVDGSAIGRQVFRRRRGGTTAPRPDPLAQVRLAPCGLYAAPDSVDVDTASLVTGLVDVALRLELARRDAGLDALTGLYNRRLYDASLDQVMARSRRYGWPFALILLDLDDFKAVNDRLGHAGGDAALRVLGEELRASLRSGDIAARIGGDEFALIVLNTDSPEVLARLGARLEAALDRATLGAPLGFSTGVACFPEDGTDAATLMQVADQRLYAAKGGSTT